MKNVMTISAVLAALTAGPLMAQTNATADKVDPAAAIEATAKIKAAQDQMIAQNSTAPAPAVEQAPGVEPAPYPTDVDPAAAKAAVDSIQSATRQIDKAMPGKDGGHKQDFFMLFQKLDANGDGGINEQEIKDGAAMIVTEFDMNGDGSITKDDMMGKAHERMNGDKVPNAGGVEEPAPATDVMPPAADVKTD